MSSFNQSVLAHGFGISTTHSPLGEQPLLDCLVSASAACSLDVPVEGLQLVHGGLLEALEIEMLQGYKLVRFGLVNLIVLEPSNLEHALKSL